MGKQCVVYGCSVTSSNKNGISTFGFPKTPLNIRRAWVNFVKSTRKDFMGKMVTRNHVICALHFTTDAFEQEFRTACIKAECGYRIRRTLKRDAVPTVKSEKYLEAVSTTDRAPDVLKTFKAESRLARSHRSRKRQVAKLLHGLDTQASSLSSVVKKPSSVDCSTFTSSFPLKTKPVDTETFAPLNTSLPSNPSLTLSVVKSENLPTDQERVKFGSKSMSFALAQKPAIPSSTNTSVSKIFTPGATLRLQQSHLGLAETKNSATPPKFVYLKIIPKSQVLMATNSACCAESQTDITGQKSVEVQTDPVLVYPYSSTLQESDIICDKDLKFKLEPVDIEFEASYSDSYSDDRIY